MGQEFAWRPLLACLLAGAAGMARALDGDLDLAFGDHGVARVAPPVLDMYEPAGPVLQRDGKIVVCGTAVSTDGTRYAAHAFRLNADGSSDLGFGEAGRVELDADLTNRACAGFALQGDDRIVIATTASVGGVFPVRETEARIVRLNANGSRDPGFGDSGTAHLGLPEYARLSAMATQPDGAIVVGYPTAHSRFGLARLRADGAVDPSFGVNGRASVAFPAAINADIGLDAILIDPQGRIVAVGTFAPEGAGHYEFAAARVLPDGRPDPTFGQGGRTTIPFGGRSAYAPSVLLQGDGRIVLAGMAYEVLAPPYVGANNSDVAVARLQTDGSLDASFGEGGRKIIPIDLVERGADAVRAGVVRKDGKLVLVGRAGTSSYWASKALILQLDERGELDPEFGTGGVRTFDLSGGEGGHQEFHGIVLQGADYVVAGSTIDSDSSHIMSQFVVRLEGKPLAQRTRAPPASLILLRSRRTEP